MNIQERINKISLWKRYKEEVWYKGGDKENTVHSIMRMMRCIPNSFSYVSAPITSGPLILKEEYRKDKSKLIAANFDAANSFLNKELKFKSNHYICPWEFTPMNLGFSQDHYQALWLNLIAEKCDSLYITPGWTYSIGCVEEFIHAFQISNGLIPTSDNILFNVGKSVKKYGIIFCFKHKAVSLKLNPLSKQIMDYLSCLFDSIKEDLMQLRFAMKDNEECCYRIDECVKNLNETWIIAKELSA